MTESSSSPDPNKATAGLARAGGAPVSQGSQHAAGMPVDQRVEQIAVQCGSRDDFLRYLAGELQIQFATGFVAVQASEWAAPMMLVTDDATSAAIDRDSIRGLLESASPTPIACSIPAGDARTRGLRIELTPVPDRAVMLLVYPIATDATTEPTTSQQIQSLQLLNEYATSSRRCLARWNDSAMRDRDASTATANQTLTTVEGFSATPSVARRDVLRTFHRDLDLSATAYRIANETRSLVRCDRVTVLIPKRNHLRVKAISGVAVADPRSNAVRSIERMANQATVLSRPLVLPGNDLLPPQIQDPLDDYLDESGVTTCVLLPLHGPERSPRRTYRDKDDDATEPGRGDDFDPFNEDGEILGVIALEYFAGHRSLTVDRVMRTVSAEAAMALRNSLEHDQVFGLSVFKAVGQAKRSSHRWAWITGTAAAACLLIASLIIQVDHQVIATGQAQPQVRRNVFAGVDGVVKELLVDNGQPVAAGDPLVRLENAELETRLQSLVGELQTSNERLASIRSMRLGPSGDNSQASRLAMEERQLETEILGLNRQKGLLDQQQDELLVRSPITGRIIAWRLAERLSERPVTRGVHLLTVVDESGPWELSLSIPDDTAGPVLESAQANGNLGVTFAIATQPSDSYPATLKNIATATRLDETGQYLIDATASIADEPLRADAKAWNRNKAMIGADVTARIACDRRSLLSSWFSDVIDFAHRNILFYFR